MATVHSKLTDIPVFFGRGNQSGVLSKMTQIQQFTTRGRTIGAGYKSQSNIPLEKPPFINVVVPPDIVAP